VSPGSVSGSGDSCFVMAYLFSASAMDLYIVPALALGSRVGWTPSRKERKNLFSAVMDVLVVSLLTEEIFLQV